MGDSETHYYNQTKYIEKKYLNTIKVY